MKATLIKEKEGVYSLLDGNRFISTTECKEGTPNKLSIKNCEAIANGYDLDELAEKHYNGHIKRGHTEEDSLQRKIDFTIGFVSALEILGDKKFSEEDMIYAYREGGNDGARCESMCDGYDNEENIQESIRYGDECREEFKKSLQQTEWKVEIVTKPYTEVSEGFNLESKREPKLDADGCIVLKRI